MRKVVKIGDKDYSMKSSAYTQFKYKNDTGRRLLEDINKISKMKTSDTDGVMQLTDELLELVLTMAYIMIDEADDKQVTTYEEFLKSVDVVFDVDLMNEVLECAIAPFQGGIQKNSQNQ